MKTLILFTALFFTFISFSYSKKKEKKYGEELPKNLQIDNSSLRTYLLETDYYDYDLKGNFKGKKRVTGNYTRGLINDSARWNDVYIAEIKHENNPFPNGIKQDYMNGFTYSLSDDILSETFFETIPQGNILAKNLIWDATGFEVFAYMCWDSLKLNEEYMAKEINSEFDIANVGTFENKDIRLTWIGTTQINDETCAIIKLTAMNNPLRLKLENMTMTGRSHYWGEVYVSLEDKQIEYANLKEDVLSEVKIKGQEQNIMRYTVRNINLTRIEK